VNGDIVVESSMFQGWGSRPQPGTDSSRGLDPVIPRPISVMYLDNILFPDPLDFAVLWFSRKVLVLVD